MTSNNVITKAEARALGYVYGTAAALLPDWDRSGDKFRQAGERPFTGMGLILAEAHRRRVMTREIDEIIGKALEDVTPEAAEAAASQVPEPFLPMPLRGVWQLGYYAAQSGKPYYDITARREEAGMTQAQLAERLGVPQSTISRWESGKVRPRTDMMARIKTAISASRA